MRELNLHFKQEPLPFILIKMAKYNRIYLDEIFLSKRNAGFWSDANDLIKKNSRNAPLFMQLWDTFYGKKIRFKISILETGREFDEVILLNSIDGYNFGRKFGGDNGGGGYQFTVVAKPYEIIDETIPQITKMYGINRFFNALKGKNRYRSTAPTAVNSKFRKDWLTTMFNDITGASITESNFHNGLVWLGNRHKNIYGNTIITQTSNGSRNRRIIENSSWRMYLDLNDNSVHNVPNNTLFLANALGSPSICWFVLDSAYTSVDKIESGSGQLRNLSHKRYEGNSIVIAHKTYQSNNSDNVAMVVKPLGIDVIIIDFVDFYKYDLEFVYSADDWQSFVEIKTFTSLTELNPLYADHESGMIAINNDVYGNKRTSFYNATQYKNIQNAPNVRFRLRDKKTGRVGKLTNAAIVNVKTKGVFDNFDIVKNI